MTRPTQLILMAVGAVAVVALAIYLSASSGPDLREVEQFRHRFSTLVIGESKEAIIQALGGPDADDSNFHQGPFDGYEDDYRRIRQEYGPNVSTFWYDRHGFVFMVGFDENQTAVLFIEFGPELDGHDI